MGINKTIQTSNKIIKAFTRPNTAPKAIQNRNTGASIDGINTATTMKIDDSIQGT